jgi:hypothetical protein
VCAIGPGDIGMPFAAGMIGTGGHRTCVRVGGRVSRSARDGTFVKCPGAWSRNPSLRVAGS